MSKLPTHAEWLTKTNLGAFHGRSDELKAFDDCLKRYHQQVLDVSVVKKAFNIWIAKEERAQGKGNWFKSPRNKAPDLMVSKVYKFFHPVVLDDATKGALDEQKLMRSRLFRQVFDPSRVQFELGGTGAASQVTKALMQLRSAGSAYRSAQNVVAIPVVKSAGNEMVNNMFGSGIDGIRDMVTRETAKQAIGDLVPVLSHFVGAARVLQSWGTTAVAKYREYSNFELRGSLAPSTDVQAAFAGLNALLVRETSRCMQLALINSADFATKALLSPLDGGVLTGPAATIATCAAKVAHQMHYLGMQWKETLAGQTRLLQPKLDERIFNVCPLLGAYFIACVEDAVLIDMSVVGFGSANWKNDVLALKPAITQVRENAAALVEASPFKVTGLSPLVLSGALANLKKGGADGVRYFNRTFHRPISGAQKGFGSA